MAEIRETVNTSAANILNSGADIVTTIEGLLDAAGSNHTKVFNDLSTQTYTRSTRDNSGPHNYDRKHLIYQKSYNGNTTYFEMFNLLVEVEGGENSSLGYPDAEKFYYDTVFLCFAIGTTLSGGELTDRGHVFAIPVDWVRQSIESEVLGDYEITTADTALGQEYAAADLQVKYLLLDTPSFTTLLVAANESDDPLDLQLYCQGFMVGELLYEGDNYSNGTYLHPFYNTEDIAAWETAYTATFSGLSGYYKPSVNVDNLEEMPTGDLSLNQALTPQDYVLTNTFRAERMSYQGTTHEVIPSLREASYDETNDIIHATPNMVNYAVSAEKSLMQLIGLFVTTQYNNDFPDLDELSTGPNYQILDDTLDAGKGSVLIHPGVNYLEAFPDAFGVGSTDAGDMLSMNLALDDPFILIAGNATNA